MQPPDPDSAAGEQLPDDISRTEHGSVSIDFSPDTGLRVRRGAVIAACGLAAAFILIWVLRYFDERAVARAAENAYSAPPPVDVVIAHAVSAGPDLVLPGQTAAWYDATIYSRVNGYVAKWSVDIGDHVKKGQVLAVIKTPELDAELNAAKAQLRASKAQVSVRRAEAEFSRTTNERWRDSPKGVVSDQERESKKADYESAQARLYAAEAQVALDSSRVEQYGALAQFKQVAAPFDGTITERKIDVGNLVTAGSSSTTTPLYRMSQTDPLRVFVDVPQSAAAELTAGVPAEIRPAGGAGAVVAGKIARSAESISAQSRTMRVEVDIPNTGHALVPGMYVSAAFRLQAKGVVEVPAAALVFRADGPQVAKVDAGGKIQFESVAIARDNGSQIELASGIRPGDRLVLNISSQIASGQKVAAKDAGTAVDK